MRGDLRLRCTSTAAVRATSNLRILKTVWTEDVVGFDGRFYQFEPLGAHPHPIQKPHPPIWVGGHTRPAPRRTAQFGDGWLRSRCLGCGPGSGRAVRVVSTG